MTMNADSETVNNIIALENKKQHMPLHSTFQVQHSMYSLLSYINLFL